MTKDEFLDKFRDVLRHDSNLTGDMFLIDLDEWDSLAVMSTVAFLDEEFGIKTSFKIINDLDKVDDVIKLAGIE